jgi:hypothetical protein
VSKSIANCPTETHGKSALGQPRWNTIGSYGLARIMLAPTLADDSLPALANRSGSSAYTMPIAGAATGAIDDAKKRTRYGPSARLRCSDIAEHLFGPAGRHPRRRLIGGEHGVGRCHPAKQRFPPHICHGTARPPRDQPFVGECLQQAGW